MLIVNDEQRLRAGIGSMDKRQSTSFVIMVASSSGGGPMIEWRFSSRSCVASSRQ
jgi:hypothetical protein